MKISLEVFVCLGDMAQFTKTSRLTKSSEREIEKKEVAEFVRHLDQRVSTK
jgi:hypothetical protein